MPSNTLPWLYKTKLQIKGLGEMNCSGFLLKPGARIPPKCNQNLLFLIKPFVYDFNHDFTPRSMGKWVHYLSFSIDSLDSGSVSKHKRSILTSTYPLIKRQNHIAPKQQLSFFNYQLLSTVLLLWKDKIIKIVIWARLNDCLAIKWLLQSTGPCRPKLMSNGGFLNLSRIDVWNISIIGDVCRFLSADPISTRSSTQLILSLMLLLTTFSRNPLLQAWKGVHLTSVGQIMLNCNYYFIIVTFW